MFHVIENNKNGFGIYYEGKLIGAVMVKNWFGESDRFGFYDREKEYSHCKDYPLNILSEMSYNEKHAFVLEEFKKEMLYK